MNWELFSAIAGVNIAIAGMIVGLMLWIFSKLDYDRRESNTKIQGLAQDIHDEMKEFSKMQSEFNARLCTLEERYMEMMERFMQEKK